MEMQSMEHSRDEEATTNTGKRCTILQVARTVIKYVVLGVFAVALVALALAAVYNSWNINELVNTLQNDTTSKSSFQRKYEMIGYRQDYRLQECQSSDFKQSFSDVDYALLGYNILRGFPLAVGHDPGFTYPIFRADYSSGAQTGDCRYSVPDGLVIIPDVSCVTSFESSTVRNKFEFAKELSASAHVEGGGWGVKFSASAGYRKSSSEIAKGESVYIHSTAKCNYYYSRLITDAAPRFTDVFIQWLYKLHNAASNQADSSQIYIDFFETFGTHFPTDVTFGARYTYEHKMSSYDYQKQTEEGKNVAVEASYHGLFSVGGGFELDSSQRQAASNFSKHVETKTITVGAAPPANGDAMTWASEVKTSPVPTSYKLASIEHLFVDTYMKNFDIDYNKIQKIIEDQKYKYCKFMQEDGQVESCRDLAPGITLEHTRIVPNKINTISVVSISECLETCLQQLSCFAMSYCITCKKGTTDYKTCYTFYEYDDLDGLGAQQANEPNPIWQSYIFPDILETPVQFSNMVIIGVARGFDNDGDKRANQERCKQLCMNDNNCVAYTHCDCPTRVSPCQIYSKGQIKGLKFELFTTTFFIEKR